MSDSRPDEPVINWFKGTLFITYRKGKGSNHITKINMCFRYIKRDDQVNSFRSEFC